MEMLLQMSILVHEKRGCISDFLNDALRCSMNMMGHVTGTSSLVVRLVFGTRAFHRRACLSLPCLLLCWFLFALCFALRALSAERCALRRWSFSHVKRKAAIGFERIWTDSVKANAGAQRCRFVFVCRFVSARNASTMDEATENQALSSSERRCARHHRSQTLTNSESQT